MQPSKDPRATSRQRRTQHSTRNGVQSSPRSPQTSPPTTTNRTPGKVAPPLSSSKPTTAGAHTKLAPRRWWIIMPIVFITYSLAYLDRANYGFASAAGINRDLGITHGVSSLLGALFFLGYFFFQLPGAIYAERRSVKKLVFVSLLAWGLLAAATGMVNDVRALLLIRFFLGVVEAAVMPAMLIFISNWFTRRERSRANTFLILGNPVTILWMSVLSGYLVDSFGWRAMFIGEGVPAILWAVCWWFLVKDRPRDARWMTDAQLTELEQTLEHEQQGLKPVRNYGQALRSGPVVLLAFQFFFWSIGVYGFVLWLPSILKDASSLGMVATGWLSALPYFAATIAMIAVSWRSDKRQSRMGFVWPSLLIGAIAFGASCLLGKHAFWWSYTLLVIAGAAMYAPYGPFFAIVPELLPKNVAGGAMAVINGMGALGSFVGSYAVGALNGATGSPGASYALMSGSLLLATLLVLAMKKTTAGGNPSKEPPQWTRRPASPTPSTTPLVKRPAKAKTPHSATR